MWIKDRIDTEFKKHKDLETFRDWLRNFVEDQKNKSQMSVNVYNSLWNMIQSIDKELGATQ